MDGIGGTGKAITIYDIAKEAGVSAATVSRVITGSSNVRREKKERIEALIEKYNFKPNALARGLVDSKSKSLGIVVADVRNPFYSEIFVACEVAARQRGYTVFLCNTLCDKQQEASFLDTLAEKKVDAIIQIGGNVDDMHSDVEFAERVKNITRTVPVIITGKLDGADCYQVQIDAVQSMKLIMEHLSSLGHRKIALVGGYPDVLSTYEKIRTYREMVEQYGLVSDERLVGRAGNYDYSSGYEIMGEIFDSGAVPTAVIGINEYVALGALRRIKEQGYRVPEDISLVSYDNTFITGLMLPRMTSIDYQYGEFGKILVGTAIDLIEGNSVPRLQYKSTTLVQGDTTVKVNPDIDKL